MIVVVIRRVRTEKKRNELLVPIFIFLFFIFFPNPLPYPLHCIAVTSKLVLSVEHFTERIEQMGWKRQNPTTNRYRYDIFIFLIIITKWYIFAGQELKTVFSPKARLWRTNFLDADRSPLHQIPRKYCYLNQPLHPVVL